MDPSCRSSAGSASREEPIEEDSCAAHALLDYRDPPRTERSDLLYDMRDHIGVLQARIDELKERHSDLQEDHTWTIKRARLRIASTDAVLVMAVARLGGTVEGRPTIRLNFLQRIDELREIERRLADIQSEGLGENTHD